MNEAQRSVLQRHTQQLADDIMVTEELLAAHYQKKIFDRNMIDAIKAEKTPNDQIYKLLAMLPKTMLSKEINKLIKKIEQIENTVNLCYRILGDPDRPQTLPNLIRKYMTNTREMETELKDEKKKIDNMLTEMYDNSKTIHSLETTRQLQRRQQTENAQLIDKLKDENAVLNDKYNSLEAINLQHAEKEQTLVNLRKMVQDLKTSKGPVDESANYKYGQSVSRTYKRPPPRIQNQRGSLIDTGLNNTGRRSMGKSGRNIKPVNRPYPGARY